MRRKPKVEKVSIHVSLPKELLEECDLYIDNYSAYFKKCLENKLLSIQKKQKTDIIQTVRTSGSVCSTPLNKKVLVEEEDDKEYEELLARFIKAREEHKKKSSNLA